MHFEDGAPSGNIRAIEHHLAVEAAGPEQCRIKDVRTVGRRDHDDIRGAVEPIHFDQDLVQRLFSLVVASAESRTALPANRVDLVDEDDAGRVALGLVEQIANPAGADADEHLDELRAADAEEGDSGFACDGPGEEGLAGSRWSDQEHPARNPGPERSELI